MKSRAEEYSAGLMSEAPWFHEFRKIVFLINDNVPIEEIRRQCVEENLLGMPKPYRSERTFLYLQNRLNLMNEQLINIFCTSDLATQKLINFITVLWGDRLFYEFINEVYREKVIVGYTELAIEDFNVFFRDKTLQDPEMANWKDTTFPKLRSSYSLFMTDANLLRKEKSKYYITPPLLDIALEQYLQYNREDRIIKAITGVR